MAALVAAIHVFRCPSCANAWMAATSPATTAWRGARPYRGRTLDRTGVGRPPLADGAGSGAGGPAGASR